MKLTGVELTQLDDVARKILEAYPAERIFVFDAPMGAGKTTLITRLCRELGVGDEVASPTFAIVNVYSAGGDEVFHFDFYRLENVEDAFEIGFYEYLDSGNYCFLEWPGIIENYLPDSYVKIRILQTDDPDKRDIETALINQ
jgi:tRNA threonylcarbamoyladenosine biosynthesis protein TsaE